jgi:hypothetical protein
MHWERVPSDQFEMFPSSVPGGWMVLCKFPGMGGGMYGSLAFLPDPDHHWDGTSPTFRPLGVGAM